MAPCIAPSTRITPANLQKPQDVTTTRVIAQSSRAGPGDWDNFMGRRQPPAHYGEDRHEHKYTPHALLHVLRILHQPSFGTWESARQQGQDNQPPPVPQGKPQSDGLVDRASSESPHGRLHSQTERATPLAYGNSSGGEHHQLPSSLLLVLPSNKNHKHINTPTGLRAAPLGVEHPDKRSALSNILVPWLRWAAYPHRDMWEPMCLRFYKFTLAYFAGKCTPRGVNCGKSYFLPCRLETAEGRVPCKHNHSESGHNLHCKPCTRFK